MLWCNWCRGETGQQMLESSEAGQSDQTLLPSSSPNIFSPTCYTAHAELCSALQAILEGRPGLKVPSMMHHLLFLPYCSLLETPTSVSTHWPWKHWTNISVVNRVGKNLVLSQSQNQIILSLPWLHHHSPIIYWKSGSIASCLSQPVTPHATSTENPYAHVPINILHWPRFLVPPGQPEWW